MVGLRTRGVPLAQRLAKVMERIEGVLVPVGVLDITLYRDDLSSVAEQPIGSHTSMPVSVEGRTVVLVDDVLFTGRPARAARTRRSSQYRSGLGNTLCRDWS